MPQPEPSCPACGLPADPAAQTCPRCGEPLARPLSPLDPEAVRLALAKTGGRFRRTPGGRAARARRSAPPPAPA